MAISHIGSNTQDSGASQSLTFTVPAATTTDDLIIVEVKQSENTGQQVWDDDGGGSNGYTRAAYNRTTSGRDQETAIYWKFATSGSEPNPVFTWNSGGTNEPMSGIMEVYRDVDKDSFDSSYVTFTSATNDANPPNPLAASIPFDDSWVLVFHAATHDDISTVAAPTGYTLRSQVWSGTSNDHRNNFSADISSIDVSDNPYTPPDWGHSVLNTTPEYHTYTVVLPESQPIAVSGGTVLDGFLWGATNLTLTGKGFGASQLTGKVEIWSDTSGTIKTVQTIDSWSDTSIQIDAVQGSLPNNTTVYAVVTNDSAQESNKAPVKVGLLPYGEALDTLGHDHLWTLSNTYNDTGITGPTRNMTSSVVGSWSFGTTLLCEDTTHSLIYNSTTLRREIADSPNMNATINSDERTLFCWLQVSDIQQEYACVWKEGGGVQNLALVIGHGNTLMAQMADVAGTRDNAQAYSDFKLDIDRPYCICFKYTNVEFSLFIDGRKQAVTDGNPLTIGTFDSHSGDVVWGDPDNSLETGGTNIAYNTSDNLLLAMFGTFSDNSTGADVGAISDTDILNLIFRRGAIPDDIIASGTEAAMQTDIDGTADARPNWPLSYRIEAPSGGASDLVLVLNDKIFDSRISDHLEWRGTGVLTIVNGTNSNFDAAKSFSTGGGTITVVEEVTIAITVLDFDTKLPIENARVLLEIGGEPLVLLSDGSTFELLSDGSALVGLDGEDVLTGLTNASGQLSATFRYSSDEAITGRVRRATTGIRYITAPVSSNLTSAGADITVLMVRDE